MIGNTSTAKKQYDLIDLFILRSTGKNNQDSQQNAA
jgi:hypothetical protein